jgi:hypothetical protein
MLENNHNAIADRGSGHEMDTNLNEHLDNICAYERTQITVKCRDIVDYDEVLPSCKIGVPLDRRHNCLFYQHDFDYSCSACLNYITLTVTTTKEEV